MKKQSGFTLIELLLVLAIIGIISAIAIPALLGQRARAKDRASVTNVTGTLGDLVGAYDRAKEGGGDATACIAAMEAVLADANGRGEKNPWDTSADAYNETVGASATPTTKGEATFYVNDTASPGFIIGKVVTNFDQAVTGSPLFTKTVALD